MNRLGRAAVVAALATVTVRLLSSGDFGRYVQQRMRWPLIGAAAVLIVFALHEAYRATRTVADDAEPPSQRAAPVVGWLLLAPVAVVIGVVPGGLGATAANRVDAYAPVERGDPFPPLPAEDGPVDMRVVDFIDRAVWDEARSLDGVVVRLTGIVVNDPDLADGFRLTRFLVSCCAADGIPLQVDVYGVDDAIPDDTWVTVDLVWRPPSAGVDLTGGDVPIEADVVSIGVLPSPPDDPYESPF